jgi:hypothetical protein
MKTKALKNPCTHKYSKTISKLNIHDKNIRNPQWLIVEYANTRFASDWKHAPIPPRAAVIELVINIQYNIIVDNSTKNENRTNKKTPAETNVAECINADAGTGASMESGNQTWKPNCADFIKADSIKKNVINSTNETGILHICIL